MPLLLVLPHELGHAVVARAFGARPVDVYVGAEPRLALSLGALRLPIRYGRFFGPCAGRASDGYRIREALSQS